MITKEKFEDYRGCQSLGFWNMLDYRSYRDNGLTSLTKDEWLEIIKHYSEFAKKFNN